MTLLSSAGLLLALWASAAPTVEVSMIQGFRARANLPALTAPQLSQLTQNPEALKAAKIEAAQVFLSGINPYFSTSITPEADFVESPEMIAMKRDVAAARMVLAEAGVQQFKDNLLVDGKIDPDRLDAVFNGSKTLASQALALPGSMGKTISEQILDGAPKQALGNLNLLTKANKNFKNGPHAALVSRLRRALELQQPSQPIAEFERRLDAIKQALKKREFGDALLGARALRDAVMGTPVREGTRRQLWLDIGTIESETQERGSSWIYGARGRMKASKLVEHVAKLPYKGSPLSPEPTRVQCYGDCAIQQAYNHPAVAPARAVIGYAVFLDAVIGIIDADVRSQGMADFDSRIVFRALGLKTVLRKSGTEAELLGALETHGALITSIRWTRDEKAMVNRTGNHAVVVQGAFLENGRWNFVVIDSNHSRPQVMTYGELGVLGGYSFYSLEPLEEDKLPSELRGLPNVEARVKAGARIFEQVYAPKGREWTWWRRLWNYFFK